MLLRQVPNRNGYETWRQLVNIYAPRSKVRGLALLNAIMSFPPFVKSKTTREQVDGLDRLAQEYERVSGVAVNPDILLGTLLRVLPAHLRNHIQLQMKSDTSYEQVKQFILTYEVTTSNWSASKVQQSLGIGPSGGKGDGRGKGGKDKGGKGGKPNGGKPNPGGGGGKSQNANQPKGGKGKGGKAQKAPTITTSGGAASTSGTVRRVQVFDLSAPADWFIGGHVRAVTCAMQSARNPKAVQSPAGPSGQVAIGQACSSDILSPEFLEIVRMLEGSCLNSAEPVRVLESSDAVSSESRGSSVPAGPFYFDQSTVPQVSQAAPAADQSTVPQVSQFDISADDDSGSWEHGVSVHELSTLKRLEPNKGFVYAVQTIQELPSADDALDVILDSGADMSCLPLEYAQHGFDHGHVMFVQASVCNEMADANFGWQMSGTGNLYFRGRSTHYIDPSIIAPVGWPCRTTLVKPCTPDHNAWILLEHCVHWGELRELAAILPHGESDVVCILSSSREELSEFGVEPHRSTQGHIDWSGPQPGDPDADELADYEPSEADMQDTSAPQLVEAMPGVPQVHRDVEVLPDAEGVTGEAPVPGSSSDILVFEGVELSLQSTLSVIRTACKSAGISVSGSKQRCLDRLRGYLDKQQLALSAEVAQTVGDDSTREPKGQSVTKAPTEAERQLHELTHWPFRPWCDHCMAMRGVEDRHESLPGSADTEVPIISFDYAFTSVSGAEGQGNAAKLTVLVAHDTSTGSVLGLPVASKGREDLKFSAIELTRFVQGLGHNSIFLCCDNEPSTLALQSLVVNVRTKLGFKTMIRDAPVHSHASKGYVEKAIDLVRGLSNVLLDQVRVKYNLSAETISADHPLMAWSYVHASYILNRFGVKGGATAFERATGYRFASKLACFGEPDADEVFEQQQSAQVDVSGARSDEAQAVASGMPSVAGMAGMPPLSSQPPNPAPSSRATLLLDRHDRGSASVPGSVPASVRPPPPAHAAVNESPMEVMGTDPPTSSDSSSSSSPEALPTQPVFDDSTMLAEVVESVRAGASTGRQAEAEPDESHAAKFQRIARVGREDFPINDEVLESAAEWEDAAQYVQLGEDADAELDPSLTAEEAKLLEDEDLLWFEEIPSLSDEELSALDYVADTFEVKRLLGKQVLEEVGDSFDLSGYKELSTKFVRTWRQKKRHGRMMFFRRSRLVAREYKWMERDREGLYAPATSSLTTKLLPWLFCEMNRRQEGAATDDDPIGVVALDIKDAFLCVPQERPMLAKIPGSPKRMRFLKMLPGQRDGTARWHSFIMEYIREKHQLSVCAECPSLYKLKDAKDRSNPGVIHVDDLCLVGYVRWILQQLVPSLESTFELSYEVACKPGDSFKFLKREHVLLEDGILIKPLSDHAVNMCNLLEVPLHKKVPTPCTKDILVPDTSKLLDSAKAARFRSAIGIAMYVSQDRPDVAFTVRILSQKLREPTMQTWSSGQRLASYLACTTGYASKVHARGDKLSILEPSDPGGARDGVLLEVFCDADWSGNKQNRRSMSSSSFFLNSCCVYTSCKSQRCVSLSSTESEFYALVSAACDGIYLKRVLEYLLELPVDLLMRTDNASCRQISLKQGVSKIRHLDGRFLWVQEKTADGTLKVGSVDGRWNPSDLGTKVPATGSRLRALLCMHDFVDCAGDCIQEVGRADYDQLVESLQHCKDTARVRRLINKSLKTNGLSNSNLVLMMVSLIAGADASGTRRDVSVQTEPEARWFSVWVTGLVILVSLLSVMLSLERLRADRRRDDASAYRTTSAEPSTSVPEYGRWSVITATLCGVPSLVCLMLMMQLRKLRFLLVTERHETDRLQGVISEMDYDRMMWAEHHAREGASASSSGVPLQVASHSGRVGDVPVHTPELHVYCTARRGKAYHAKRGCTCLNNADEILRLGLAEAKERGYQPCGRCFGGNRKQK
ncbi:unnamed protein product [Symbiodinium sp. CCMP2592]|nr:unnamed protein product [Symbiodinium sp. CCMP2592]